MDLDWVWRLYSMTFESGDVLEEWRSALTVPLYKDKGEKNECKNYRGIMLLSMVKKYMQGP